MAPVTDYTTSSVVKSSLNLGSSYADADIALAISAASRAIDECCNRRFYLDDDANQIRYYSPESATRLPFNAGTGHYDDIAVLTAVAIDRGGAGTFSETWTVNVDFVLEPLNAQAVSTDWWPYEQLRTRYNSNRTLPFWIERSVRITAQFGWVSVPKDVVEATEILAIKLLRRVREAPFGIVTVGIDNAAAMRIARTDPDVAALLARFTRSRPIG